VKISTIRQNTRKHPAKLPYPVVVLTITYRQREVEAGEEP
jgi:hypothetical protein